MDSVKLRREEWIQKEAVDGEAKSTSEDDSQRNYQEHQEFVVEVITNKKGRVIFMINMFGLLLN